MTGTSGSLTMAWTKNAACWSRDHSCEGFSGIHEDKKYGTSKGSFLREEKQSRSIDSYEFNWDMREDVKEMVS